MNNNNNKDLLTLYSPEQKPLLLEVTELNHM